jgi:hypothetical protein
VFDFFFFGLIYLQVYNILMGVFFQQPSGLTNSGATDGQ